MTGEAAPGEEQSLWVDNLAGLTGYLPAWSELAQRLGADTYLHPAYFGAWWECYGGQYSLSCLVRKQQGRVVGILPFVIERIWIGPIAVRTARIAGVDRNSILIAFPIEGDTLPGMLRDAVRDLLGRQRCDVVSLSPVSECSQLSSLLDALAESDRCIHQDRRPDGTHTVFELPPTFEGHLSRMSKKRRSQFRRDLKALQARYGAARTTETCSPAAMEEFIAFHTAQWQAAGRGGQFEDWPKFKAFHKLLSERLLATGQAKLFHLTGNSGRLSTQYALVNGSKCHWRLPARSLDPEAEKLSAGKVGLLTMIDALIAMGITFVEAGRGEYDYKLSCGAREVPLNRVVFCRNTAVSRLVLKAFKTWADGVNFVYYRVWFLKVRPLLLQRLPMLARPLWTYWIKTRI